MRQFRFGLETLLRIRQRMEEKARREFGEQLRRVNDQERHLAQLTEERARVEAEAKAAAQAQVDLVLEKSCVEYGHGLQIRIESAFESLQVMHAELDLRRKAWHQAQQDVEVLDKLKDKRYTEYLKSARRHEQSFLDEIAASHYQAAPEQ